MVSEFDITKFDMFDEIIALKWETVLDDETWEERKTFTLEMTSSDKYKILMECKNVESFRFRGDGKIEGFYVKDMSVRGYEQDSKYEVGDYKNDVIEFYCSDIIVKRLDYC